MTTKLCECGCGQPAPISKYNDIKRGYVKGEPRRFIRFHHRRTHPDLYTVDPETGCWNWNGSLAGGGYGLHWHPEKKEKVAAHRYFYERHHRVDLKGVRLDHLCRNRKCCNPDHLEPVTNAVNCQRGAKTKLTADDVRRIRRLYATGAWTQKALGELFGVTNVNIHHIVTRFSWRNVE